MWDVGAALSEGSVSQSWDPGALLTVDFSRAAWRDQASQVTETQWFQRGGWLKASETQLD